MATTLRFAFPYLTLSDPPDIAGATEALADAAEGWTARAYPVANAAARVALASPPEGFLVRQRDDGSVWVYTDLGTWTGIGSGGSGGGSSGGGGGGGSLVTAAYSASAVQTFSNATDTPVAFGVGADSSSVTRSTKGVGHKFTLQPGSYFVAASVRFASGTAGSRFLGLRKADDSTQFISAQNDGGPNAATRSLATVVSVTSVTDIYLAASQSSGSSLATQPTGTPTPSSYVSVTIVRLGFDGGGGGSAVSTVYAAGNSGTALTLNATNGAIQTVTLTGNCVLTLSGATAGQASSIELVLTQDGTGSRTVTWPGSVKWAGGAPTLSTAAGAIDRIVLTSYNGGTTWYGDVIGKAYA